MDADKNMGTVDADKKDVRSECVRQLEDIQNIFGTHGGNVKKHHYGSSKQI